MSLSKIDFKKAFDNTVSVSYLNPEQTRNKPGTKKRVIHRQFEAKESETRNKPGTQSGTNPEQTRNKPKVIHKSYPQTRNKPGTNPEQTRNTERNKPGTNPEQKKIAYIDRLHGNELSLFNYLFTHCFNRGERVTSRLSYSKIAVDNNLKSSELTRKTLARLIEKNIVKKQEFKTGCGGWVIFEIPEENYQKTLLTRNKPGTQSGTNSSSSSSYININNTNNETPVDNFPLQKEELPFLNESWRELDIEPLADIGFTINHLTSIYLKNKLRPEIVQDSIYAFAYDLKHHKAQLKIRIGPIPFFMGPLEKGKPYTGKTGIWKTPAEEAMWKYKETLKMREEANTVLEKETKELSFQEWLRNCPESEFKEATCGNVHVNKEKPSSGEIMNLRGWYNSNVWPLKLRKLIKE